MKRRKLIALAIVGWVTAGAACSAYLQSTRPEYKNVGVIQVGASRDNILAELGRPETTSEINGKRVDVYKIDPSGQGASTKAGITAFHLIADILTIGLWEIVATPTELATRHEPKTYTLTYSPEQKLESYQIAD